jgi:hypothetical protein
MKRYENDPRPITTRFPSICATCGTKIPKGINVFYYPASRKIYCTSCGIDEYNAFLASAADEEWYAGQYR